MAKRSTDCLTVRGIVGVAPVRTIEGLGYGSRSVEIVVREQGNRKVHLRMTRKNARQLGVLLELAVP